MTRQWDVGDPEPTSEVREVTGVSRTVWRRSEPAGLFWWPRPGGSIHHWRELLKADGPVTAVERPVQGALFEVVT